MIHENLFGLVILFQRFILPAQLEVDVPQLVMLICNRKRVHPQHFCYVHQRGLSQDDAFFKVADRGVEHGEEIVELCDSGVVLVQPEGQLVELDLKDLVGLVDLVGLDQPLHCQECALDAVVCDGLLVHVLVHIQIPILFL